MSDTPKSEVKRLSSNHVLDAILNDKGPMPSARLGIRSFAFLLDFILCTFIAALLIWKIFLPQSHPESFEELTLWTDQLIEWSQSDTPTAENMPKPEDSLLEALRYASEIQLICFWVYFALGEIFLGGSFGKRTCRLRSINTVNLGSLTVFGAIVRAGIKSAAIFFLSPLGLVATFLALLFNKRRQLGHDLLSRTAVIDEKHLKTEPQTESSPL
jgi:uncharacterized RDD family membrane protein YckC